MYSCDELFMHSLKCYFGVYFPRCYATREINTKITLSWAKKQFATRVDTLFYMNHNGVCVRLTNGYVVVDVSTRYTVDGYLFQ